MLIYPLTGKSKIITCSLEQYVVGIRVNHVQEIT